jgi:hypothetical protein
VISPTQKPLPDNKHNTHNRKTSILPVGFGPTISAGERPQTYDLEPAATGTGAFIISLTNYYQLLPIILLEFVNTALVGDQIIYAPTALTLRNESCHQIRRKFPSEVWSRHGGINSLYLLGIRVIEIVA